MFSSCFNRISSFTYLNVTQGLGALNDNIYKLLIVFFLIQAEGIESSHKILAATGAVFVLPYLLFSAVSGTLADRFSKRDVIVITKILELVIMALGVLAFAYQSKIGSYTILFLLGLQSAIFSPSKYGIVPELVSTDRISKANGLMTSFTFMSIILGTFLASFLSQITNRNFVVSSIFCTFISLIGLAASFCIEHTPPSGSNKKIQFFFLKEIYETLKIAKTQISLLPAILGSAYFLFIGSFAQLNIIPFSVQSLHLSDIQGAISFLTALGIGTGALVAGKISGRIVELGLVPLGAFGIAVCAFALDLFSDNFWAVLPIVTLLGIFGGIYEVPLDSYVQVASPPDKRGQMFAATNFLSFIGVLIASGLIYLNSEVFGLSAAKGFALVGFITLIVQVAFTFQFFDYFSRFVAMILSKLHFRTLFTGRNNIPDCPAIYVCTHTAWNDTLLLLGSQRRRMRFFIEQEQSHQSKWLKRLYRSLKVVFIPDIEPLERNQIYLEAIHNMLKKGISVCIFIEDLDIYSEVEKLKESTFFKDIIEVANYPIIPVRIHKGTKFPRFQYFQRLLQKYRVPASIAFGRMIYAGHESILSSRHEHELCYEDNC